ncbi:MAG: hypothetical protein WBO73_13530 [Gammaproteobacteria bacterium]
MKPQHSWLIRAFFVLALLPGWTAVTAFPEIPFCPLGGPPGWWNRIVDDDHDRPPPHWYPPPLSAPYWGPTRPYGYVPLWRDYPPPVHR